LPVSIRKQSFPPCEVNCFVLPVRSISSISLIPSDYPQGRQPPVSDMETHEPFRLFSHNLQSNHQRQENSKEVAMATQVKSIGEATSVVVAVVLTTLVLALSSSADAAIFETYQTGDGVDVGMDSPNVWIAQTFVASSNHTVKFVQLFGKRETSLTTGTITVSIKATDGDGFPTGPDLTSASEVVTTVPYNYGWFTVYLPTCALISGTRYAVVVRASNVSNGSEVWWSGDSVRAYPTGVGLNSLNGGSSWTDAFIDLMFIINGDATEASVQTGSPTANSYPGFDDWYVAEGAYENSGNVAHGGKNVVHNYNNFNFSIPAGSVITGIEVRLDAWYVTSGWPPGGIGKFRTWLSWDNGTSKTALIDSANVTDTEATYYVGGPTSTWGRTWSSSDFNNGSFQLQLMPWTNTSVVSYPNQMLNLDFCPVTVYYTAPPPEPATVTTATVSAITLTTATGGGNVTSDGGGTVTARGVCWGTSANPTVADSHTTDGSGTGLFVSSITGLSPATTYHVRAYATNTAGTAYGDDLTFSTNAQLTLTIQGTGSGVVHSTAPDINCSSGTCNQSYPYTSVVALTPIGIHSIFDDWSGDCSGSSVPCSVTMDAERTVLASFAINPDEAVWNDPGSNYFPSIYAAYQVATSGVTEIKACRITFDGDLNFDLGKTVSLKGGYNSSYLDNSGVTTINGDVTLKSGSVTLANIAIK
jgi:hypothetical protein